MLNAIFRPILTWPGKETPSFRRRRSTFRASYPNTLDLLERELQSLNAKDIVIQADFEHRDIRNDGWPRSSARPRAPRVIVSCVTRKGPLSFPCDTFDAWEDNLRAIALSLQALRAVDRYGVTRNAEQYKGWQQLPAPAPQPVTMSTLAAASFISAQSGLSAAEVFGDPDRAYRMAAGNCHPDSQNGSHEAFIKLQQARDVLKKQQVGG